MCVLHGERERCLGPPKKVKAQQNKQQLQPTPSAHNRHHYKTDREVHHVFVRVADFFCTCVFLDTMGRLGRNERCARGTATKRVGGPKLRCYFRFCKVLTFHRKLSWQAASGTTSAASACFEHLRHV